jgi:hypothetical protein
MKPSNSVTVFHNAGPNGEAEVRRPGDLSPEQEREAKGKGLDVGSVWGPEQEAETGKLLCCNPACPRGCVVVAVLLVRHVSAAAVAVCRHATPLHATPPRWRDSAPAL